MRSPTLRNRFFFLLLICPFMLVAQSRGAKFYLSTHRHVSRQLVAFNEFQIADGLLNAGKEPYLRNPPFTLSVLPSIGVFASRRLLLRSDFTLLFSQRDDDKITFLEIKPVVRYYIAPAWVDFKPFLELGGSYTVTNQDFALDKYGAEVGVGFTHLINGGVLLDGILTYRRGDLPDLRTGGDLTFATRIGFLMDGGAGYGERPVSELRRGRVLLGLSHFRAGLYSGETTRGAALSFRPQLRYLLGKHVAVGGEVWLDYDRRSTFLAEVFTNGRTFEGFAGRINVGGGPNVRVFANADHRSLFFVEAAGRYEHRQTYNHYLPYYSPETIVTSSRISTATVVLLKTGLQHFLNTHAAFEVAPALSYDFAEELYRFRVEFGFQVIVGK